MATEQDQERASETAERGAGQNGAREDVAKLVTSTRKRPSFWVRLLERYVFIYLFIVVFGLVVDAVLRSEMDTRTRNLIGVLAWASTALYALALVVLLVAFSMRLRLRQRHSKALWLLYLGLAGLLVARGYFSASLLEPSLQQGTLAAVMADVGLFSGTAIVLGMIGGILDVIVYAARRAGRGARRVRLPRKPTPQPPAL